MKFRYKLNKGLLSHIYVFYIKLWKQLAMVNVCYMYKLHWYTTWMYLYYTCTIGFHCDVYLTLASSTFSNPPVGRKHGSGVLSFLRGSNSRDTSPKPHRKQEYVDTVKYTPKIDLDSVEIGKTSPHTLSVWHKSLFIHKIFIWQ